MQELSIIIVSFNTKELTKKCLESILGDKGNEGVEIVVVDNKSTDGSVKMLRKLWGEHKNILLVENSANLGFSKAVNIGIEKAKGSYVLLLNSDTEVKKGAIKKLLNFAKNKPGVGGVAAKLLNEDGSTQPSCFNFPTISNAIKEYIFGLKGSYEKFAPLGKTPVEVDCAVMAVFLLTPAALEKVGLLDERYFLYYEDHDYCKRINQASLKIYYVPNSKMLHYHGESGKKILDWENQWRRLIPSSKIYHGLPKHYLIYFITKFSQKVRK